MNNIERRIRLIKLAEKINKTDDKKIKENVEVVFKKKSMLQLFSFCKFSPEGIF